MLHFFKIWLLWLGLSLTLHGASSDDILGCGGFVKSEVDINFSLVEVKLYTKQGSLKYQMDCAPNNGYYMIPVYDKGDYVLKVEPPKGWNFEPSAVDLHIDGQTDACSRGEDVNFHFIGFSMEGAVASRGQQAGPADVVLTLVDDKGKLGAQQTTSTEGGRFRFDRVLPGSYKIEASHPVWQFDKNSVSLKVDKDNVKSVTGIVVHGYDLSGRVLSDGDAVPGVNFLLYSTAVKASDIRGCITAPLPGLDKDKTPLCHVVSGADGRFRIASLPSGQYSVVPFYKGDQITFVVEPSKRDFHVHHASVTLEPPFQVAGFSVRGRVLDSVGGSGVSGAKIYVNEQAVSASRHDGTYVLEHMKTGTYNVRVTADKLGFDAVTVKISPNTPSVPDIAPSTYSLCGAIVIDKLPRTMPVTSKVRAVKVTDAKSGASFSLSTDEGAQFCSQVKPGTYKIQPILSDEEVSAGLKLSSTEQTVTVTNKPVTGIVFSQFKASASGTVKCIGRCPAAMHINLVAAGSSGDHRTGQLDANAKSDSTAPFSFKDLMPGRYQAQLVEELRCWADKSIKFEVVDKDVTALDFHQSGFVLSYTSSHSVTMEYQSPAKVVKKFDTLKGSGSYCVEEAGIYTLVPKSCHRFDQESYKFDTASPTPVIINAVKHQLAIQIKSSENVTDLKVEIRTSGPTTGSETIPLVARKDETSKTQPAYLYTFVYWTDSGSVVVATPSAKTVLIYPPSHTTKVRGDTCPGVSIEFEARKGLFISGRIEPALEGVHVTVLSATDPSSVITRTTDTKGAYIVGPLDASSDYKVTAEKEGYVMTEVKDKLGSFKAFKLGQITVKVVDEKSNALASVLLSLSGGDNYRSNKLTLDDGTMVFTALSPGQYFMRPMMKEYEFDPSTKMMDVTEGTTVTLSVKGKRVAYSFYGAVTSLNGEAEAGVLVEAVGRGGCSEHQEESKTEKDGTYRIRGLKPKCEYEVRLKDVEANEHIERSSPKINLVKVETGDVDNVNIIAFRRLTQMDMSGRVVVDQEFLSSLKVILFNEERPDDVIHTASLSASNMFYLPSIAIDNQSYVVRLKSTLSQSQYEYSLPEITFRANTTYKHFVLHFEPKIRNSDQELSHGSFLIVPLTLLVLFLSYNHDQIKPFLATVIGQLTQKPVQGSPSRSSPGPADDVYQATGADPSAKKKMKVRRT